MKAFFQALHEALLQGKSAVLCSVLAASGSTPRGAGAKMAVFADGSILGTVGGGAVEQEAIRQALQIHAGEPAALRSFTLKRTELGDIGMICGGNVTICFLLLAADREEERKMTESICAALSREEPAWLVYHMQDGFVQSLTLSGAQPGETLFQSVPVYLPEQGLYAEPLVQPGTVYIVGGGHVGQALARLLPEVGFRVTVYDAREPLLKQQVGSICAPFSEFTRRVQITQADCIVIMTPGHLADREVLLQALQTPAGYIGCIGSHRKIEQTNEALRKQNVSEQQLARIHAPIGLEIFAETPNEIAVSIAAELIRHRAIRNGTRKARRG